MNKELISIIIPCYQAERTIEYCVNSILAQKDCNTEILLIDDGSQDNTAGIIDYLSKTNKNVFAFHKENGGVSSARNYGLNKARGEYVTFVDSDDYLLSDFCVRMLDSMKTYHAEIACCKIGGMHYSEDYVEERSVLNREQIKMRFNILYKNWFFHNVCGKLYVTEFAKKCTFKEGLRIGEDLLYNFDYFRYVKKSVITDYYGYQYLLNDYSAVHRFQEDDYAIQIMIRERSIAFANENLQIPDIPASIDKVFINNIADIIVVCITYADRAALKSLVNKIMNDRLFCQVASIYRAYGIKRQLIIALARRKCIAFLRLLGKINRRRHKL